MSCTLCSQPIHEPHAKFCCMGCQTVYAIISSQEIQGSFKEHPLFQKALEAGIISQPELLQKKEYTYEVRRLYLEIENLWCPSCADVIQMLLLREEGIKSAFVDYATDYGVIEYYPQLISKEKIYEKIQFFGYLPKNIDTENEGNAPFHLRLRLGLALFAALNLMMFSSPLYLTYFGVIDPIYNTFLAWSSFVVALPCMLYSGWPIFKRSWSTLKAGIYGMELLITLGVISSFVLSMHQLIKGSSEVYFDSLSMILVFVLWGKILETKAKSKAKNTLTQLCRTIPKKARKKVGDAWHLVSIKEVSIEDILIAYSGEKIALDGVIIDGEAGIDESMMTGEAYPKWRKKGDALLSGTLVKSGWVSYRVKNLAHDSFFQKIIDTLQKDKEDSSTLLEKIVRVFIPCIVFLSFATFAWMLLQGYSLENASLRSIALLFISCPCAIGIAIPLVESTLLTKLALKGVIVRNRQIIPKLSKPSKLVLDKTGTLTYGKFEVLSSFDAFSEEERIILKSMTAFSQHPISCAIYQTLQAKLISPDQVEEISGMGIKAIFQGQTYLLGSAKLVKIVSSSSYEGTEVYFKTPMHCHAIKLGDTLRQEAKEFKEAIILSGDSSEAVSSMAKKAGIATFFSQMNPLEKREKILELKKNGLIAMVGDGMNDAPALAAADIGISMLKGCDVTLQTSDVILTSDSLLPLKDLFHFGQKAQRLCRQNLFWAFFYNSIGILLALFGIFPPIIAALAMSLSSLMILLNSRRL